MGLRILLIDDHTLFRSGLEGLLAHRNIEVVASVGDGREGLLHGVGRRAATGVGIIAFAAVRRQVSLPALIFLRFMSLLAPSP